MKNRIIFWIWLQQCFGMGTKNTQKIFKVFESPEQVYLANEGELLSSRVFTDNVIKKIMQKDLSLAKKIYDNCKKLGYQVLSLCDDEYPKRLKEIKEAPLVLYVDGDISYVNKKLCIAIVGSREATVQSQRKAFFMSKELSDAGNVIVSGGARGVDSFAHVGSIVSEGKTVCVLGCGIDQSRSVDKELKKEIAVRGTVISEYPPYMQANNYTFIHRDRIISGMSDCTVVVQAGDKSGTMTTARKAGEQGRPVFVFPSEKGNVGFKGSEKLIAEGKPVVTTYKEVLELCAEKTADSPYSVTEKSDEQEDERKNEFLYLEQTRQEDKKTGEEKEVLSESFTEDSLKGYKKILNEELTEGALKVYDTISDIPVDIDRIVERTGMAVQEISASLTELEIEGLVECVSGNRYIRK